MSDYDAVYGYLVENWKTEQFLKTLRDNPFVAVVLHPNDQAEVFLKDVSPDALSKMVEAVTDLADNKESHGQGQDQEEQGGTLS